MSSTIKVTNLKVKIDRCMCQHIPLSLISVLVNFAKKLCKDRDGKTSTLLGKKKKEKRLAHERDKAGRLKPGKEPFFFSKSVFLLLQLLYRFFFPTRIQSPDLLSLLVFISSLLITYLWYHYLSIGPSVFRKLLEKSPGTLSSFYLLLPIRLWWGETEIPRRGWGGGPETQTTPGRTSHQGNLKHGQEKKKHTHVKAAWLNDT